MGRHEESMLRNINKMRSRLAPSAMRAMRQASPAFSRGMAGGLTPEEERAHLSDKQRALMKMEDDYGTHNYHPLPVVLAKGVGNKVWDVDGKEYFDYLSAYSAVNQGHCHPRIIKVLQEQAAPLTLSSRAFWNDQYPIFCKFMSDTFKYE